MNCFRPDKSFLSPQGQARNEGWVIAGGFCQQLQSQSNAGACVSRETHRRSNEDPRVWASGSLLHKIVSAPCLLSVRQTGTGGDLKLVKTGGRSVAAEAGGALPLALLAAKAGSRGKAGKAFPVSPFCTWVSHRFQRNHT